ncbi:hypothetical protein C3K47_05970 [Solitalea longa]|uniref:Uncharacterized protein n=1 Tax=Solitalea longa TaxID=2079460 RepID=A0A2S5A406_9SPHI|nr:hypothetical protein [Solitalea longa]POY37310.1 hypothetical protein C3K47_05970 [Solitalea longa]
MNSQLESGNINQVNVNPEIPNPNDPITPSPDHPTLPDNPNKPEIRPEQEPWKNDPTHPNREHPKENDPTREKPDYNEPVGDKGLQDDAKNEDHKEHNALQKQDTWFWDELD